MAEIKTRARAKLHKLASVPALYFESPSATESVDITVRWHNKIAATGDLDGQYAQALDAIDRLVFHTDDLNDPERVAPVVLKRAGEIVIPSFDNVTFSLDQREPSDGPGRVVWTVARLSKPRAL
jgi:hypothetical protein